MTEKAGCTHAELVPRVVALEAEFRAFEKLMNERDARYDLRAKAQDNVVNLALAASDKAITKAELAVEKRLEGLNELRGLNEDQAKTFARDAEVKLAQGGTEKRIDDLAALVQLQQGRGIGLNQAWGYIVGAAGLGFAAVAYFHK